MGNFDYNRPDKPKSIKELIPYLKKLVGDFLYRLFYIFGLVWQTSPFILIALMLIALVNGVLPVLGAVFSKNIINALQHASEAKLMGTAAVTFNKILFLLIAYFLYSLLKDVIGRIDAAVKRIAGELLVNTTKLKIMNKAKDIDLASFDQPDFYEKLENANREASNRPLTILSATFSIVSNVITLISFVIALAAVGPWITVIVLMLALPSALVNFQYRKKTFEYMRSRSIDRRQMMYYSNIVVNKDIVKEIRLFGLAETFTERYKAVFKRYFKGLKKLIVNENLWHLFISIMSTAFHCGFYIFIAFKCFNGNSQFGIGDYTFYTGALSSIAASVSGIVSTTSTIYEGTLFIDNIISFLNEKKSIKPLNDTPKDVPRGNHIIEFVNVSFKYPGSSRFVLKNINLTIKAGETVVLVGLNGAGKTTLIKLITRLYDPTEGQIFLDGIDIREYEPTELYKIFGIIFQDFGKYAETVSENIRFGDIDIEFDSKRIEKAAQSSNVSDYIEKLEKKYDTPLTRLFDASGTELSGGQWQKLAVARAFYGDYDILILDEPTASLDAIAEQEIFNQFDSLRKDKITIFVSHRLSSATIASKIIVLDGGEIAEVGNHKELMKRGGIYYNLFSTQARRYIEQNIEREHSEK